MTAGIPWAILVMLLGVFSGFGVVSGGGQSPSPSITITVSLSAHRVVAGTPIRGTAILTNSTSRPIVVQQCAINGWIAVGLSSTTVSFSPAFSEVACPPSVVLRPGSTRVPVMVATTYQTCLEPGGSSLTPIPRCVTTPTSNGANALPPLPAGTYRSSVVTVGLPAGTKVTRPVNVTLLASGRGRSR